MDTIVRVTLERFREGLTIAQYAQGMEKNKEFFEENYGSFNLSPRDVGSIRSLGLRLNVLALAEDWCGDVLRYLPALGRMAEAAQTWDVSVFYRDANPDLADLWLKDSKDRAIPLMVFFDKEMNEIARFVEKPSIVYGEEAEARKKFAAENAMLPDAGVPATEMGVDTYNLYVSFIRQFRTANRLRWQQVFVEEVEGLLRDESR